MNKEELKKKQKKSNKTAICKYLSIITLNVKRHRVECPCPHAEPQLPSASAGDLPTSADLQDG